MQFGVGYPAQDPRVTGRAVREREGIQETLLLAQHAEDVGLDVFASGEHHNPPFWFSSPPATLACIAAKTATRQLTT
jgi:alkanesulfonate monooxygenase SsuD/methylene tetrahydromethanopterin reductase-like flavin-dependent oxidoreductase (luciferase family)